MCNCSKRILQPDYIAAHANEFVKINADGTGYTSSSGGSGGSETLQQVFNNQNPAVFTEENIIDLNGEDFYIRDNSEGNNEDVTFYDFTNKEALWSAPGNNTNRAYVDLSRLEGGTYFDFVANANVGEVRITGDAEDSVINVKALNGMKYFDDYSGAYTERSLVDKAYVDNRTSGATGSFTSQDNQVITVVNGIITSITPL